MDRERFQRARALFERARELPTDRRSAFLKDACPEDVELRAEVDRLLQHDAAAADEDTAREPAGPTIELSESESVGAVVFDAPAAVAGQRIDRYELIRPLGEGGMGEVWEARQTEPVERRVALKIIRRGVGGSVMLARFEAERQALALMSHPNIARILDAGADEFDRPYFVMEHVAGDPIDTYCDRNNLSTEERLALFIGVCEGVQHAHQKGIIHRDIKPSNILVAVEDAHATPKIIDFGVARATDRHLTERSLLTEFGQVVGTPEYMSPEQAEMSGVDIDTRTDVYSLGVVLYRLLSGRLPFDSEWLRKRGFDEMRRVIREVTPPKPSTRVGTLGDDSADVARHRRTDPGTLERLCRGDLDWITMKALEKDRTRRYASASEFATDIGHYLRSEPVSAGPPSGTYRLRKFVRRHRVGVGLSAAMVVLFVAGFVGTLYGLVRATTAERQAVLEADTSREVSDFMVDVFEANDPSEARGREITVKEVLDRATRDIRHRLRDRPVMRGRLLERLGTVYRNLGLYDHAEPILQGAIDTLRGAHGSDHPDVAVALDRLASVLLEEGRHEAAAPLLVEAWRIQDEALPPDHPERAKTLNNRAILAERERRSEAALELFRQALEVREAAYGPDDPEVAKTLSSIGVIHASLKEFDEAERVLRRAVAIHETSLSPDHPLLATALHNLAGILRRTKRNEEAFEFAMRALEIRKKVFEPGHLRIAESRFNVGLLHEQLIQLPEAAAAFRDVIPVWEEHAPEHDNLPHARRLLSKIETYLASRESG